MQDPTSPAAGDEEARRIRHEELRVRINALREEVQDSDAMVPEAKRYWQDLLTSCLISSNGAVNKIQAMSETQVLFGLALVEHVTRGPENLRNMLRQEIPGLLAQCLEDHKASCILAQKPVERGDKVHDAVDDLKISFLKQLIKFTPKQWVLGAILLVYLVVDALRSGPANPSIITQLLKVFGVTL